MPNFSPDEYFTNRAQREVPTPAGYDGGPSSLTEAKQDALMAASAEKTAFLAEMRADKVRDQDSVVSQLDLDPEGLTGRAVNFATSLMYQGTFRAGGSLLEAPFSGAAAIAQDNLSEADLAAIERHRQNQANGIETSPEDLAQINRKVIPAQPGPFVKGPVSEQQALAAQRTRELMHPNAPTALELYDRMNEAREIAGDISRSADRSSAVHQGAQAEFNSDLVSTYNADSPQIEQGWEALKAGDKTGGATDVAMGVAKLLFHAGTDILSNPQAVSEYIGQNAPQLFMGAAGTTGKLAQVVDNASVAADAYNRGIQNYQAKNNGALPPEAERQRMAFLAATHAAAEQAGDVIGLSATKLFGKAAKDVSRTSFKEALKGTAKGTVEGIASEGPTEAWQTKVEGDLTGEPATGADIFVAGAIGAASGAGLSGGGRAVHETAKLAAQPSKSGKPAADTGANVDPPAQQAVQEAAIASGDVSVLTNPKGAAYKPEMAVAALIGHSELPTTTDEQKQANVVKANEIVTDLENSRDGLLAGLATPEEKQAEIDDLKTTMAAIDPTETATIDQYKAVIAAKEAGLTAEPLTKQQIAQDKVALIKVTKQLEQAKTSQMELNKVVTTPAKIDEHLDTLSKPVDSKDALAAGASQAAAESVINLAMASPDALDVKKLAKIVATPDNGLAPPHRAYLSAFLRARESEPSLTQSHVAQDIYFGKYGNKGVVQFRELMNVAVVTGNALKAQKEVAGITKFAQAHQAKATAATQAIKQGLGTPILKENGQWVAGVKGQKLTAEQKEAGGRPIDSGRLVQGIQGEATALQDVAAELKAAYNLKFNTSATTGASHVKDASQPGSDQAVSAPVKASPVASEGESSTTPSRADVTDDKPAAVVGTPAVQTSRVEAETVPVPKEVVTGIQAILKGQPLLNGLRFAYKDSEIRIRTAEEIAALSPEEQTRARSANQATITLLKHLTSSRPLAFLPWAEKTGLDPKSAEARNRYVSEGRNDLQPPELDLEKGVLRVTTPVEEPLGSSVITKVAEDTEEIGSKAEVTQSVESTDETQATPSGVDSTTDEATKTEPVAEIGELSSLSQKSPEGTVFKARNLIADFFKQSSGQDGDKTLRPLVAVKDFLSQLSVNTALQYLSITELTDPQRKLLKSFKDTAASWQDNFTKNLDMSRNPDFYYTDMMQFLMQRTEKDVDLEENLKTAMSYAAFSTIAEMASRSRTNSPEEINLILGRDEDHHVSNEETSALAYVGTRQGVVANTFGQRAVQALGLKTDKRAPADLMPRLESALGAHIFKMLMDQGILERVTVPGEVMKRLTGSKDTKEAAEFQFLRLARDSDNKPHPVAEQIYQDSKGTQGVLDKLFSVESALKEPSFAPIPYEQTKTKNTNQAVPSKLAAIIQRENAVANHVREDMWQLVGQLDEDTMIEIAGAEHLEGKHVANQASVAAANDGLLQELTRFKDFVGGMPDVAAAMYFDHTVWKQQRVGIATNMINPQTSKIHRHMLFRKAWETKIDRNDAAQMETFQLRVAEGLGIKTDKQSNDSSLLEYQQKVTLPEITAAVDALVQMLRGEEMTAAKQATLITGVKVGGEKMHSLDALMALAHEQFAIENKQDSFTVQMVGEVDGVTNGPMLSHLLMGAAYKVKDLFSLLNRGGFFEVGNEHSQYNLWRAVAGHFDLYENTTLHMVQSAQAMIKNGIPATKRRARMSGNQVAAILDSIYSFTGPLTEDGRVVKAGRNIIKTPLTAMVFGSSVGSAVESMANKFVESIHSKIEDLAAGKGDRATVIENINLLLNQSREAPWIASNLTTEQLMAVEFTPVQVDALKWAFKLTLGEAVASTMKNDFSAYIEQRQEFNNAAQMTFELYNAAYTGLRDEMLAELVELVESGEIAVNGKGQPIHDLNVQQEAQLRKRLAAMTPLLHTPMSKDSGQLNAGLYISKSARKLSTRPTFGSEIKFGTKFGDTGAVSTRVHAFETAETAPGVAMAPMSIHSADSAVMHESLGESEALNVHDAKGVGVGGFQQAAQSLNAQTWKTMLNYSPASEMFGALSRTVLGLAVLVQKGDLPASVTENLTKALATFAADKEMDPRTVLADMLTNTRALAFRADDMKLQVMELLGSIDQYALQGGNYTVTEENRAEAAARRAELPNALSEQETEALTQLDSWLSGVPAAETVKATRSIEEDAPVKKSPFGELGTPAIKSDPDLVAFFEKNPTSTMAEVALMLYRKLKADPVNRITEFQTALLQQLAKSGISRETPVRFITKDTPASAVRGLAPVNARGWYISVGNAHEVNLLGPDFLHSGLTAEALLHEITHTALARIVEAELAKKKADPKYTSETLALVDDLETLRNKAATHAKSQGLDTQFAAALDNVHEFMAWGMTNQEFQRKVLSKITMQSKTRKNTLLKGMESFIKTLVGILFKGSDRSHQAVTVNGMTTMVNNVAGLLNAAKWEPANAGNLTLTMSSQQQEVAAIDAYSTHEVYEALRDDASALPAAFNDHLGGLLSSIIDKLHGPFGAFKESMRKNEAGNPLDTYIKALDTGKVPFAADALNGPFTWTQQTAFVAAQVEATMQAALQNKERSTTIAYNDLKGLYNEMEKALSHDGRDFHEGDWFQATHSERAHAKAQYESLFKLKEANGDKLNHLARFAAIGLTNEKVNRLLQRATDRTTKRVADAPTWSARLQTIFENVLDFLHNRVMHTYKGQNADEKLNVLVEHLVDIEAREKARLARQVPNKVMDAAEGAIKKFSAAVTDGVVAVAGTEFVRDNKLAVVRATGALTRTYVGNRMEQLLENMRIWGNRNSAGQMGVLGALAQEYVGQNKAYQFMLRVAKINEGARKDKIVIVGRTAIAAFANAGKSLKARTAQARAARNALTPIFMRTGAHNLLDHFGMKQLEDLLGDKAKLNTAIADFENRLGALGKLSSYFTQQANILAANKVFGGAAHEFLNQNAYTISRMYGTTKVGQIGTVQADQAEALIKPLIALYALRYFDSVALGHAQRILAEENARPKGEENGIEFLLNAHKHFEVESLARIFQGDPTLMVHGYTAEIYDNSIDVQTANAADGKDFEAQGYKKWGQLDKDRDDPNREVQYIYYMKDGGVGRRVSGVFSNKGERAKGSPIHNGYLNANTVAGLSNAMTNANIAQGRAGAIAALFQPGPVPDLSKGRHNHLAPVFNRHGEIVKWRYLMAERTKDTLLNRDNRFDKVLGHIAGSLYDKETTPVQNLTAVKALKEQFDYEKSRNPSGYLLVGARSTDPELKEIWDLLPEQTQYDVKREWGMNGMMVRKDNLHIMFGYRKLSLAATFRKDPKARGEFEKAVAYVGEAVFGRKAYLRISQIEKGVQELVGEAKDIIVIKTGVVLLGNMKANMWMLHNSGVPLAESIRSQIVAWKGAKAYQRDNDELEALKLRRDSQGTTPQLDREITQLETAVAGNPVGKLIDGGLMPTIVEDLDPEDDQYSYKGALAKKVETVTDRLPPSLLGAAKTMWMAHDTPLYKALRHTTQLSDFVARYALYTHLTTRKDNPLSHGAAIQEASDTFVNYDVPMHPLLQYSDDHGITYFTKYFLRIQRVLAKTVVENPARVFSGILLAKTLGLGSTVLEESSMWTRIGNNPIQDGPVKFFESIDDMMTAEAALTVFDMGTPR